MRTFKRRPLLAVILILHLVSSVRASSEVTSIGARLDGGSEAIPSNLPGKLCVDRDRIQFHAFPQFAEYTWSCAQVLSIRSKKQTLILMTASATYRFHIGSSSQADQFVADARASSGKSPE